MWPIGNIYDFTFIALTRNDKNIRNDLLMIVL